MYCMCTHWLCSLTVIWRSGKKTIEPKFSRWNNSTDDNLGGTTILLGQFFTSGLKDGVILWLPSDGCPGSGNAPGALYLDSRPAHTCYWFCYVCKFSGLLCLLVLSHLVCTCLAQNRWTIAVVTAVGVSVPLHWHVLITLKLVSWEWGHGCLPACYTCSTHTSHAYWSR